MPTYSLLIFYVCPLIYILLGQPSTILFVPTTVLLSYLYILSSYYVKFNYDHLYLRRTKLKLLKLSWLYYDFHRKTQAKQNILEL